MRSRVMKPPSRPAEELILPASHLHAFCGGRLLYRLYGDGGVQCAECGESAPVSADLCFCGQKRLSYRCLHKGWKEVYPESLKTAFLAQGIKGDIGLVSVDDYEAAFGDRGDETASFRAGHWTPPTVAEMTQDVEASLPKRRIKKGESMEEYTGRLRTDFYQASAALREKARRHYGRELPPDRVSSHPRLYRVEDCACSKCGSRILRGTVNNGMSPGGNPYMLCSGCGRIESSLGSSLCYCAWEPVPDAGLPGTFQCVKLAIAEQDPPMAQALLMMGIDWRRSRREIGVISRVMYQKLLREHMQSMEAQHDQSR